MELQPEESAGPSEVQFLLCDEMWSCCSSELFSGPFDNTHANDLAESD